MDLTMTTTMNTTTTSTILTKNATALIAEDSMVWIQGTSGSSCKPVSIVAAGFPLIISRYMFEELLNDRGGRFSERGMC